jgi:predicted nucleic acid-binding protein
MRLVDADILSYALFRKHDAHPYCWPLLQDAIHGRLSVAIATVSLLEAYHALVEDYMVEREEAFRKLDALARSKRIRFLPMTIDTARKALEVAKIHEVRSFDANLVASAEINGISVIVSNDKNIGRLCRERGLILENPIPEEVTKKMRL